MQEKEKMPVIILMVWYRLFLSLWVKDPVVRCQSKGQHMQPFKMMPLLSFFKPERSLRRYAAGASRELMENKIASEQASE